MQMTGGYNVLEMMRDRGKATAQILNL